jgi:hypothetical protein
MFRYCLFTFSGMRLFLYDSIKVICAGLRYECDDDLHHHHHCSCCRYYLHQLHSQERTMLEHQQSFIPVLKRPSVPPSPSVSTFSLPAGVGGMGGGAGGCGGKASASAPNSQGAWRGVRGPRPGSEPPSTSTVKQGHVRRQTEGGEFIFLARDMGCRLVSRVERTL